MTEIYLHIVARMADYMATHPYMRHFKPCVMRCVYMKCARMSDKFRALPYLPAAATWWWPGTPRGVSPLPFALAQLLVALPQHGEVLKRDGKRVRVDLSKSGGPKSKWTTLDDICKVRAPTEKKAKPTKVRANELVLASPPYSSLTPDSPCLRCVYN